MLGVICFGDFLCYTDLCSSSLALVYVFWLLRCLGCLAGAGAVELSLFLLICLLFAPPHVMSFVLLFVFWFLVGRLLFLQDRDLVSSCNLVWLDIVILWSTGGEGALLFWS